MSEQLPRGWSLVRFERLVDNLDGKRVPVRASDRAQRQGQYPYYGASGVIDQVEDFLFDGDYLLIAEDGANLLSRSTPIAFQAHGKFWVNNHAHLTKPLFGAPLGYLEAFLNSIDLAPLVTGSAQPKLTQKALNRIEVPVAPLNEQRRIVAKLEALQARSRRAREALDAVSPLLEKLRQSILAAAFRGDLTKDWRAKNKSVEPAAKLLERIRAERRKKWEESELAKMKAKGKPPTDDKWKSKYKEPEPVDATGLPELPEGWCWASLDELTESSFYGPRFAASDYVEDGVPTIRTTDMDDVGRIRWRAPPRVRVSAEQLEELCCRHGDLLVTRTGSIGKCAVYEDTVGPALPSAYLIRFRLVTRTAVPRFVFRALQTPRLQAALGLGATATTQPNINARTLGRLAIAVCDFAEQSELVRRLEDRLAVLEHLTTRFEACRGHCGDLDRAVLAKAFRGELVPQDPNDEPAATMLASSDAPAASTTKPKRGRPRARSAHG